MAHPNNSCYRVFYYNRELGIWGIEEAYYVNIYVIEGDDKALVIDTGRGIGNLKEFVSTLTKKPLIVVNTHKHFDHTSGNGTFCKVHMLNVEIKSSQPDFQVHPSLRKENILTRMNPNDNRPYNFSVDYLTNWPKTVLVPISDGHVFELGNRPIEVIHTNGHTKGSICLLDKKARILFTGDTANRGVLIGGIPGQSVSIHQHTLINLLTRRGEFDFLFLGHDVDSSGTNQIEEIISAEQDILNGTGDYMPCNISWPCEFLYTKGKITIGFDLNSIYRPSL